MFISYPTEIGIGIDHVTLTIGGMINVRLVSSLTRLDLTKNKICSEVIWMLWNSCIQTCKTGDQPYSDGVPPPNIERFLYTFVPVISIKGGYYSANQLNCTQRNRLMINGVLELNAIMLQHFQFRHDITFLLTTWGHYLATKNIWCDHG